MKGSAFATGIGAAFVSVGQIMHPSLGLKEDPFKLTIRKLTQEYRNLNVALSENQQAIEAVIQRTLNTE